MAIGPLPPVINEIQANSGQPGKTLTQQATTGSLVDVQAAATAEPTVAIVPESTLIEKAVAEALGRQGGLAPLYATLAELAEAPDLPDTVKAAINTLLAFRLGDGDVTPKRVAEAIRASGLFHEAVAAGKMAAVLPPSVRQALGGAPEQKQQVAARPAGVVPSPAIPATASRPAPVGSGTSPPAGLSSPVAGSPPSQGSVSPPTAPAGNPAASAGSIASPSVAPTAVASPVAATQTTSPGAALVNTVVPSAGVAAAPIPSSATGETPQQGQPATAGSPSSLPTTAGIGQNAPTPTSLPLSGGGGVAAPPTPATESAPAAPSSPLPPSSGTPTTAPLASPPAPSSGNATQTAPVQVPASDPLEAGSSTPQVPAVSSAPPAGANASARTFAPWTPGRPLVQAASPAPQVAAPPPPAGSLSEAPHSPTLPPTAPSGSEAVPQRLPGDKALFVPSTVDSLPSAPPGATTPPRGVSDGGPAPLVAPGAAAQPAAEPVVAAALAAQPGPSPAAAQGALPSGQSSQTHPGVAAGTELFSPPAQQSTPPTTAMPLAVGIDLKGALEVLRRELVVWLGRNANVMASLDGSGDDTATRLDRPLPPRKGGPMRGQPAVPLLGNDETETTSTEKLAGRALGEAERSLSRVFLHQATTAESRDLKAAHATQAFVFEIPIAGPNGTSVAQLRIERDDHAPNEPGTPPRRVFQVDIAFDIAPLGPVAVRVGLMDGRRVAVGVWCESDDGLVRMEAERENIVLGLEQEGMVVAGVDLHRGHPPEGRDEMAAAASHRLDLQL